MSKKTVLIILLLCAAAPALPAFAFCGIYLAENGLSRMFWLLLAIFLASAAGFVFYARRWMLLPARQARAALEAVESPDSPQRLPEDAGVFSPFSRGVNHLLDECALRQKLISDANERSRLIAGLSDDIAFEFDLVNGTIRDSLDWDRTASGEQFVEGSITREIVHPDDAQLFRDFFRGKTAAGEYRDMELRLRTHPGSDYQWTQIHSITLGDAAGNPVKILGRRYNIEKFQQEKATLQQQAQHDLLTGLYNKRTAEQLMSRLLQEGNGKDCALIISDIDDFKGVNDSLGHLAGDEVLREAAAGISGLFRKCDIVGRIGGDEFLVLFTSDTDMSRDMLRRRCRQILDVFQSIPACGRYGTSFACSVGVACCPMDGVTFSTLYQNADKALYRAKETGRGQFAFFDELKPAENISG